MIAVATARRGAAAREPPEARGLARDSVRLLVSDGGAPQHARFRDLPDFLRSGDLLVVNTSATLAAAVDGLRADGSPLVVHFSTRLDDGGWAVEPRPPGPATGPLEDVRPGETIALPGGALLYVVEPWPAPTPARPRLWRAQVIRSRGVEVSRSGGEVSRSRGVEALLQQFGRPITYAYVRGRWPLEAYQTVFGVDPGSAEMPSAGRPFTSSMVQRLRRKGIRFAGITLHTGVSSLEAGEAPLPEPFVVPRVTARRVAATRRAGGRVVAVGTTVARALESAVGGDGSPMAASGWTDLVLSPARRARLVDGIITGWHAPGASHLELLQAIAGPEAVRRAYVEALGRGYLWHEFGDSALLFGPRTAW